MAYSTINDPSAHFQTATYTGNGSTQSITNSGNSNLKPDFAWIKDLGSAFDHKLQDSNRGSTYTIESNTALATYNDTDAVTSFNTDGFSLGSNANVNDNTANLVAWQWKANGGTTSSNGSGSITSTVQANTTAGFSIVTYTGTGSNATVGHGLGVAPDLIFVKLTSGSGDWTIYSSTLGNTKYLRLNGDIAAGTQSTYWQDTSPTSTAFSIGTAGDVNTSSGSHVAYCFTSIQGYSKFGTFLGDGQTDGPFIYTGFKPAWVMTKNSSSAGGWAIMDAGRNPNNVQNKYLIANTADVQATGSSFDIDSNSNGFKIRANNGNINANGDSILYMAFAENTLVGTNNIISLAR
jgi:hypothetical protein